MKRILVISDIHGCYQEFVKLLNKAQYNPKQDQLILLGDYIDRGDYSFEVVQLVKELIAEGAIALKGNHEDMAIKSYCSINPYELMRWYDIWLHNGGQKTLDSYNANNRNIEDDLEFLNSLPTVLEMGKFTFVHAGLKPKIPLYQQKEEDMLWIRDEFLNSNYNFDNKIIIFGHTPLQEVWITKHKIGIDTGCVFDGKLSCLELPTFNVYSVQNN